mgnify:CR=1 FL=1
MAANLENGCGERKWREPDARKGKEARGKHTGNKSGETRGGPVPIEKQNGDNSHGGNREGRRGSDFPGDITQTSRRMAKGP